MPIPTNQKRYTVLLTVEVVDIEAASADEAIAYVRDEIRSVLDIAGAPTARFYKETAESYEEEDNG